MLSTHVPIDIKYIVAKFTENNINKFVYLIPGTAETLEINVFNVSIIGTQIHITASCSIPLGGLMVVYRHKNEVMNMTESNTAISAGNRFEIIFDKYNKVMPFIYLILYTRPLTWEEATYTWLESEGDWNTQLKIVLE